MGDAVDKVGRGGEEMAAEKSGRLRGSERGLGEKTEERHRLWGAGRDQKVCERGRQRKRRGTHRESERLGEGLEGPLPSHLQPNRRPLAYSSEWGSWEEVNPVLGSKAGPGGQQGNREEGARSLPFQQRLSQRPGEPPPLSPAGCEIAISPRHTS